MPLPALFLKPYLRIWKIVVPLPTQKAFYLQGEMAEWSIAAVLKTVEGHTSGGSNPSLSAETGRPRRTVTGQKPTSQ